MAAAKRGSTGDKWTTTAAAAAAANWWKLWRTHVASQLMNKSRAEYSLRRRPGPRAPPSYILSSDRTLPVIALVIHAGRRRCRIFTAIFRSDITQMYTTPELGEIIARPRAHAATGDHIKISNFWVVAAVCMEILQMDATPEKRRCSLLS